MVFSLHYKSSFSFLRYICKVNRKQGELYKYLNKTYKAIVFIEFFLNIDWQRNLSTYTSST